MKRLHIVGGKNHGKTTLMVELVQELARRGVSVGTVKHTHHQHELDVPGKDSHRHREAGANVVGILSPSMTAVFRPVKQEELSGMDPYEELGPMYDSCQLMLVEGDSQTAAPKIEVWREGPGTTPRALNDPSILAVVTDDPCPATGLILARNDVSALTDWIVSRLPIPPIDTNSR